MQLVIRKEPAFADEYESHELGDSIESLLPNKREQRLAYLLYHCGLKAWEIVRYCPDEFSSVQEIYRLTRTIVERIMRHRPQIRWHLSEEEP